MNILERIRDRAKQAARALGESVGGATRRLRSGAQGIRARIEARRNIQEETQPVQWKETEPMKPDGQESEGEYQADQLRGPFIDVEQAVAYSEEVPMPTEIVAGEPGMPKLWDVDDPNEYIDDDDNYLFVFYVVVWGSGYEN